MRSLRLGGALMMASLLVVLAAIHVTAAPARLPEFAQGVSCPIDGFPKDKIEIMAPAGPGGGWDTTAREMQRVLQDNVVEQSVEVYNVEGAGGTVGLAQLAHDEKGNENQLMMMGLVMVGAIATNQSAVSLDDVTPLARLTTEYEVIVVPAGSPYKSLDDLIAAFKKDPTAISWGGGSAGGTDHILAGLIAKAEGIDPTQVNYVPFSGGGEALAAILGGQVSAGISGVGEWIDQIEAGKLRALAVSGSGAANGSPVASPSGTPTPAVAPTLRDQGVDVELANWRGVVAPPGISDETRQCMIAMVDQMHSSDAWTQVLTKYGWQDYFLSGDEFSSFLGQERERVTGILKDLGLVS
jgi:putative tricarboxylic transport membrane protein